MTVLFTDSAVTLNQQTSGSDVTLTHAMSGSTEIVNLLTSSGSAWVPTSGYSIYNAVRAESPVRPEFASGSRDPMIFVIEKSNDASNTNLFVWAFDESGTTAKASTSIPLTTTPVGLTNIESKYLVDLNKNQVVSDYGRYPEFVQLEETVSGFVFDLGYAESKINTGLTEALTPLKTSSGGIWSAISSYNVIGAIVSNDYSYSYNNVSNQHDLTGSLNLTLGVLSDPDGLTWYSGVSSTPTILTTFTLNDAGTQFIQGTASLTNLVADVSLNGPLASFTASTANGIASLNFIETVLNKDIDNSGYIGVGTPVGIGSLWTAIATFQVTASDVIYNNGRFFSKEEHHLLNTKNGLAESGGFSELYGYTFYETSDLRFGTVTITPQVLFEEHFTAGGVHSDPTAIGGNYVFAGHHHGDIFAAYTSSANSTGVLEIFDSPYYFSPGGVDVLGVSQTTSVPVFRFVEALDLTSNNTSLIETNFNRDINGDGRISAFSGSSVIVGSIFNKTITHASGETTISTKSPTISKTNDGAIFWFQSAESALNVLPSSPQIDFDNYHQIFASAGLSSSGGALAPFSANSSYTLTGGYVESKPLGINASAYTSSISGQQDPTFKLVYNTNTSNSYGSVFSVYSFYQYSALDAFSIWNSASESFSVHDLESFEVKLKYDITGDGLVGNDALKITNVIVTGTPIVVYGKNTSPPSLVKVTSGSYAVDVGQIPSIGSLASGKLLVNSSGGVWSASTSSNPVGIYESTSGSASSIQTFVLTQMSGTSASATYSSWIFSAQTSSFTLQTSQVSATSVDLIDLLAVESGLNYDITGDGLVGDKITDVFVQTTSRRVDSNGDGIIDSIIHTPAVIKSSLNLYGFDYTEGGSKVGDVHPFVMLKTSTNTSWSQSNNMKITGAYEVQQSATMSQITLIEKGGTASLPIYQKWLFNYEKGSNIAAASNSVPTAISVADLIGEEQSKNVDLNGDGVIGDQILKTVFSSNSEPSLVQVQTGNYGIDFPTGTVGVSSGIQVLLTTSGTQWQPSRNVEITGIFAEQTTSAQQTITVVEKSGSSLSPTYNNWKFTLDSGAFFATATSVISTPVSTSFLNAAESRNNIDLLGDGLVGDRITSVITNGGRFSFDSDNDGFADKTAIAPTVIKSQSGAYGLDVTGEGKTGEVANTLYLEANSSSSTNWVFSSGAEIIGGYISYGINALSQQETRGHIFERSGADPSATYTQWTFLQGSASGVAVATSSVAQTVQLTDILTKEISLGFDLTNDEVVGDRVIELTKQIPQAATLGAPSLVKAASGAYGIDTSGNAAIGDLKQLLNLKTNAGTNWAISSGASVTGVYSIEEYNSLGQLEYTSVIVEKSGSSNSAVYKEWVLPQVIGQNFAQATASLAQTVDYTDILAKEAKIGFDLTSDGMVGDRITEILWKADVPSGLNPGPSLANVISGAYGVDYNGVAVTGGLTALVNLETSLKSNWSPTSGSKITGVYTERTSSGSAVTTQTFVIEKSGSVTFPSFAKWTFTESSTEKVGVATSTAPVSISESELLAKEIAVGYDLNADTLVGEGISSVLIPSQKYLSKQTGFEIDSPSVVRLASGEFGLVASGNNYLSGDPSSFSLRESVSSGGAQWSPNTGYYLSGVYKTSSGYTVFEQQDVTGGTHKYKQTDFALLTGVGDKLYVSIIDGLDKNSDVVSSAELTAGYDLDLNKIIGSGAETIAVQSYEYQDKFSNTLKSPTLAKLADGGLAVDFSGNVELADTPEMLLQNTSGNPYTFTSDSSEAKGLFTSDIFNTTSNKYDFVINLIEDRGSSGNNSYFLNKFTIKNDTLAIDIAGESATTLSAIRAKEEVLNYDLDEDSKIGFLNKELLVPAYIVEPGPDDFDLIKTETNAIGLQSKMWLVPGAEQLFFSLHTTNGGLWNPSNQQMKGFYIETRSPSVATASGETTAVTYSGVDTKILGIATAPSSASTMTPSSFSLWEFTVSADAVTNELGLMEFTLSSDTSQTISFDALSVLEAEKGFDLTGDRQVLGSTSTTTFKTRIEEDAATLSKVNIKLSALPSDPTINESSSKLLQSGVSLETNVLKYGDVTIDKNILNSFLSNGAISIELDDSASAGMIYTSNIEIDASLELSVYEMDQAVDNFDKFVEVLAGSIGKSRTESAYQALTDFTNAVSAQSTLSTDGEIYLPKMKTFDLTKNATSEVDKDEIKIELAEGSSFVLLGDSNYDGDGYNVNLDNVLGVSSTEILLLGDFILRGGDGSQIMVGDEGIQDVMLGPGDDVFYAGGGNDIIASSSGDNYFDGGAGNDAISGGSGKDVFIGGYGDDQINGGDGTDIAHYVGSYFDFTVVKQLGSYLIEDNLGLEGSDNVSNVERIEFVDGVLAFDTNGNAGQAYRLYQAAFERTPDSSGVNYHVHDIEGNGLVLHQIAANFLASPEFESTYGSNLSDSAYVDALYENVLGRAPADSEKQYYLDRFTKPETDAMWMDHAAALIGFSESPENMTLVASQIEDGIWLGS